MRESPSHLIIKKQVRRSCIQANFSLFHKNFPELEVSGLLIKRVQACVEEKKSIIFETLTSRPDRSRKNQTLKIPVALSGDRSNS